MSTKQTTKSHDTENRHDWHRKRECDLTLVNAT